MKKKALYLGISASVIILSIASALMISSCSSPDTQMEPYRPAVYKPVTDLPIMGKGRANSEQLQRFFLSYNPNINRSYLNKLANTYISECAIEGVNSDVAFVQMCHETNFLRFGNQVKADQNNFAGIGATDNGAGGASFSSMEQGVRAQVHHLKAYASKQPLNQKNESPRFNLVRRGSAVYVSQLGKGMWATDPDYAAKLMAKINELYKINGITA